MKSISSSLQPSGNLRFPPSLSSLSLPPSFSYKRNKILSLHLYYCKFCNKKIDNIRTLPCNTFPCPLHYEYPLNL